MERGHDFNFISRKSFSLTSLVCIETWLVAYLELLCDLITSKTGKRSLFLLNYPSRIFEKFLSPFLKNNARLRADPSKQCQTIFGMTPAQKLNDESYFSISPILVTKYFHLQLLHLCHHRFLPFHSHSRCFLVHTKHASFVQKQNNRKFFKKDKHLQHVSLYVHLSVILSG